jgi:glycerate-2-kinase
LAGTKLSVLSAGTDGVDGPTDAAGAVADATSLERARDRGMDPTSYLEANDSYHFFDGLGDLVLTGPTGTNVMDLKIAVAGSPSET